MLVVVYKIDMNLHKCIRMLKKHYNRQIKLNKFFTIIHLVELIIYKVNQLLIQEVINNHFVNLYLHVQMKLYYLKIYIN